MQHIYEEKRSDDEVSAESPTAEGRNAQIIKKNIEQDNTLIISRLALIPSRTHIYIHIYNFSKFIELDKICYQRHAESKKIYIFATPNHNLNYETTKLINTKLKVMEKLNFESAVRLIRKHEGNYQLKTEFYPESLSEFFSLILTYDDDSPCLVYPFLDKNEYEKTLFYVLQSGPKYYCHLGVYKFRKYEDTDK